MTTAVASLGPDTLNNRRVFWGCFIALLTSAFGFAVRTQVIDIWAQEFNLSKTQAGDILGVGFWPFAISIIAFSFFIDKIGYGWAAILGLVLHTSSTLLLIFARNFQMLYWGTFLLALASGTVEAYINVTAATMYPQAKAKWLNILHAGWPVGMVIAAMLAIFMGDVPWQWKIALTFVPTVIYALTLLGTKFPVSERVAAGVSYREMLQDFGALGVLVSTYLIALQVCQLVGVTHQYLWALVGAGACAVGFYAYARSLGQPLYIILLLIMLPLGTTELGIDSWITPLMAPEMSKIHLAAGWVFVYTSLIMAVLRFFAGPVVERLSPLGLLACCAALAIAGLLLFSQAAGMLILISATVYGVGKTFFWPTMLAIGSERFPRGGVLTINCLGGVGMLSLSLGGVFLGNIQDRAIDRNLLAYDQAHQTALHQRYMSAEKSSVLGNYRSLDQVKLNAAPDSERATIDSVAAMAKQSALKTAAILPVIMLVAYLLLILYFRARGGYKAEHLTAG